MDMRLKEVFAERVKAYKIGDLESIDELLAGLYDWHVRLSAIAFFEQEWARSPGCLPKLPVNKFNRASFNVMLMELAGIEVSKLDDVPF